MTERDRSWDFLGQGWAFPFELTPDTGRIRSVSAEENVRQSIRLILATAKGERVMRPDFGCGIHDLVFAVETTQLLARLKREVEEALRTYEARIVVNEVIVARPQPVDGRIDIMIDYQIRSTNQPGNYVYHFYFQEAGGR